MILQLRHIFFTDACTFISLSSPTSRRTFDGAPPETPAFLSTVYGLLNHFALNVIRARDRS
jgi:hypothetical protein